MKSTDVLWNLQENNARISLCNTLLKNRRGGAKTALPRLYLVALLTELLRSDVSFRNSGGT